MILPELPVAGGVFMMGIGGVSMSALAEYLFENGVSVRGEDRSESDRTEKLQNIGIPVEIGEGTPIEERVVVYSEAVKEHVNFEALKRAGKRLLSRAELLGEIAKDFQTVISVAGCHGKTTTTAMIAHVLAAGKRKFTSHIGGDDLDFSNYHSAGKDIFLTEACEYRRSFLTLKSSVALVLNVDRDHTDCYRSEAEIREAFSSFVRNAHCAIVCETDSFARRLPHTASFGEGGDYTAQDVRSEGERYSFTVCERGTPLTKIRLRVTGEIEVQNALAAFAVGRHLGLTAEEIKEGIQSFRGVKRRFEGIGTFDGVPVVADYAHHPREIACALQTASGVTKGRVHVVFQPHTFTRTRDLLQEFVSVLKRAENPIIYETYPAREAFDYAGSAVRLVSLIPEAAYVRSAQSLTKRLRADGLKKDDLILVLGAGDVYDIANGICRKPTRKR